MVSEYDFDPKEVFGEEYIVATPESPQEEEPIRLETRWFDEDNVSGEWESAIAQIIKSNLSDSMRADGDRVVTSYETAVESLHSDEHGEQLVESRRVAEALVAYFVEKDALDFDDDGDVVVLQNPRPDDDQNTKGRMVYINWAATMHACIEKIEAQQDQLTETREELRDQMGQTNTAESVERLERKMNGIVQELESLGPGGGVPESEDDLAQLSDAERQKYDRLLERLYRYDAMLDDYKQGSELEDFLQDASRQLADTLEDLEEFQDMLEHKEDLFRQVAAGKKLMPDDQRELVSSLDEVMSTITDVDQVASERVDEESAGESAKNIKDISARLQDEVQSATESFDEDVTATEAETETTSGFEQSD